MNNQKKKAVVLVCCFILLASCMNAYTFPFIPSQPLFQNEQDSIAVDIELVNFLAEDSLLSRLDVYVKIVYDNLQFIKNDENTFLAQYDVEITAKNRDDNAIETKKFRDSIEINSLDESNSTTKSNINKLSFNLKPGDYDVFIEILDIETLLSSKFKREVNLKDFSKQDIQISDILFLDGVQERKENGDYVFTPRVSNEQSEDFRILAYFEIYNVAPDDSFKIKYQVLGNQNTVLHQHEYFSESHGKATQNFIDVVGESLPHGSYRLKVFVESGKKTNDFEKEFNWFLKGLPAAFSTVDEAINALKYLATSEEYDRFKKLNSNELRQEYQDFWKKHDPTPLTSENELRDVYYSRVAYANENYKSINSRGWQTDRGWVYIMLGKPDNIQRNPYNMGFQTRRVGKTIKAVQVWDYYAYNRQLVFYDENGYGQFRLENPETLYEILKK